MGFRPEPTVYKLEFDEDTGLAGLMVRAKSCSMNEFNYMLRGGQGNPMSDIPDIDENDPSSFRKAMDALQKYSTTAADANEEAVKMFLKYAVEWDLEGEDGNIVPLTVEGVGTVEKPVITKIIGAWHMAMMSVSVPLKQQSIDGRRSEEATLDLASLSQSPQN